MTYHRAKRMPPIAPEIIEQKRRLHYETRIERAGLEVFAALKDLMDLCRGPHSDHPAYVKARRLIERLENGN